MVKANVCLHTQARTDAPPNFPLPGSQLNLTPSVPHAGRAMLAEQQKHLHFGCCGSLCALNGALHGA